MDSLPPGVSGTMRRRELPREVGARLAQTGDPLFAGTYQLVAEVASGGMATVYLAIRHGELGFEKCCAVKRIHGHLAQNPRFTDMFINEARITARLSHPYVCTVFDFGRANDDDYYLAMEFLRGETLQKIASELRKRGKREDFPRLPLIAARIVAGVAEGLHAAHLAKDERGQLLEVVHRDVSPQNLFVLYDGTVRVSDFGIAHARQRLQEARSDQVKGKLSYMAPEQFDGTRIDLRVDVWSLGVVLWEFLTGKRLFYRGSEAETLAALTSFEVPAPSTLNRHVSPELDAIVARALERSPDARYQTARDLSRDLEALLTRAGDSVPGMDLAEWLDELFPQGAVRVDALLEAARESARAPSSPSAAPRASVGAMPGTNAIPSTDPTPIVPMDGPRRRRRFCWLTLGVVVLAAGSIATMSLPVLFDRAAALPGGAPPVPPPSQATTGELLVTTIGDSARVFHQGRPLGRTPIKLRLPAGPNELVLRPDRGRDQVVSVHVPKGGIALVETEIARERVRSGSEPPAPQ